MAKESSDSKPPASVSGNSTMSIVRQASTSAKPPTMKGKGGGGVPQNKRAK
jgi:hypothetical protein